MRQIFRNNDIQKAVEEDGFTTMPFLDKDEVNYLVELYYKLGTPGLEEFGFHATMSSPDSLYRKKVDEGIKKIVTPKVEKLFIDYKPLFANYIIKEPNKDNECPIHQDWSYLDETQSTSINIWCPLVDTNKYNGAMQGLRGSHKLKTPVRFTPHIKPDWTRHNHLIKVKLEPLYLNAGEALIYNSRVIHYTPDNITDKARLAFGFVNIPVEAQSIHYFWNAKNEDKLEMFKAEGDFFYELTMGERPDEENYLGEMDFDKDYFTREELLEL
ncbi:MAG: phytanoyl-CoA dioxygenase family protein [Bacteroidetes bacterium]|nr:phytanoyl-CoA dioxygenase family protein [Bacteroidota bacterium]